MQEAPHLDHTLVLTRAYAACFLKLITGNSNQTERMPYQVIGTAC